MPRIPLIEDLTAESVPPGSIIMVQYDPASQWYNASLTMAAGWLKTGGRVAYNVAGQPPDDARSQLKRLGVNVDELETEDRLRIWDWYTLTLGQKSKEKYTADLLKVADLSITFAKDFMRRQPRPDRLIIVDDESFMARFNDEKSWVEFALARDIPALKMRKQIAIHGYIRDLHSNWVYKQLEAAHDCVVDFKLDESTEPPRNSIRIRNFRNVAFDGQWHPLRVSENFELSLDR